MSEPLDAEEAKPATGDNAVNLGPMPEWNLADL